MYPHSKWLLTSDSDSKTIMKMKIMMQSLSDRRWKGEKTDMK